MTHTYQLSGLTCDNCAAKVTGLLSKLEGVEAVQISDDYRQATISMGRHLPLAALQGALQDYPKYRISESAPTVKPAPPPEETQNWWQTYRPVLLIFAYVTGAVLLVQWARGGFDWMEAMRHFMAGFFLVFSFFKLLDVPAFAMAYRSYDEIAKRWAGWGYAYPFVELTLGILFLINFNPLFTNALTLVVMGVSTIGVVRSLLARRRFQCACLGAVFQLPMSKITLFEDALMVGMSAVMLAFMAG